MKVIKGTLEYDPELRYTPMGKAVAAFHVNCGVGGGEKVVMVRCEAWEDMAEAIIENELYRHSAEVEVIGYWRIREYRGNKYPVFVTRGITIITMAPERGAE